MHRARLWAGILLVAIVVGSLYSVSWDNVLAQGSTQDGHVEIYRQVPLVNGDGMVHFYMQNSDGQKVTLPIVTKKNTRKRLEALPESYDPRGTERETPIRDQTDTGACWAFGALKTLETDCITKGLIEKEQADFSESHLTWYSYHGVQDKTNPLYGDYQTAEGNCYAYGGNAIIAQFVLANRWGAAWEDAAPFSTKKIMTESMSAADDSLRFQSDIHVTDSDCYDPDPADPFNEVDRNEIKQAVYEHGAMDVSLYYNASLIYNKDGISSLYTNKYTEGDANHCVTIVGWDDTFNTFRTQTPSSGAWLIANSYGTDFNEQGYFWVSYYDTSLCEFYSFEGVAGDTYENAFQYDGLGWGNVYYSDQVIEAANIYTSESIQKLEAVSFYTLSDEQPYSIEIYRNVQGGHPKSGDRVSRCRVSGTIEHRGYHTVSLTEPIAVAAGETFSVIVTYYPVEGKVYVPVEGLDDTEYGWYYHGEKGQSYVYFADEEKWYDNTAVEVGGRKYNMRNMCVKVFSNALSEEEFEEQEKAYIPESPEPDPTMNTPSATPVPTEGKTAVKSPTPTASSGMKRPTVTSSPNAGTKISCKSKYVIGKGEKFTLPLNRTSAGGASTLTFHSSNSTVVQVDKNGKITGKKTGTAKVTISAISGAKKVVTVTVKKAPAKIRLKGKNAIKKGKSTKLRVILSKESASYKIRYRSSNKKIATVNNSGKVVAKKKGTVRIYAYTFNNKKSEIKIKIN